LLIYKERKMKIFQWVLSRLSEPSSYAAVAALVLAAGVLADADWLAVIAIVIGIVAVVIKERVQD
jgi:vacuolar-type H+-ATPase subunit I/STV1